MSTRPDPPYEPTPDGTEWQPVIADSKWRLVEGRRCRWTLDNPRRGCGQESVAELNRERYDHRAHSYVDSWWAYCPQHLYGRWIEGGRVMEWRLREEGS